jgi:hypothetical protein
MIRWAVKDEVSNASDLVPAAGLLLLNDKQSEWPTSGKSGIAR